MVDHLGCHNMAPPMGQTQQQTFIIPSPGSWKSQRMAGQGQVLLGPLSVAGRQPSLPVSLKGSALCVCVLTSSYEDTGPTGLHPNHLCKGPIPKHSHILGFWG